MSPFHNRLKTPEEIELDKKRSILAQLAQQYGARNNEYLTLKNEIRMFEQSYSEILGHRIAILEDLEWQLKGLLGDSDLQSIPEIKTSSESFAHFKNRTDLLDDTADNRQDIKLKSFKSLYRDVAKAIHPDLASDEEDRLRRQELMASANHAYEVGDRKTLEDIFMDWEPVSELLSEYDVALELVRVIREIARMEQEIHALDLQIMELQATDIYRFKERVDDALVDGTDLMSEMASSVDRDIAKIMNRLAVLREDSGDDTILNNVSHPLETRLIRFPSDKTYGVLFDRSNKSVDFRDWQRIGNARGAKEVFLDMSIRLDVKGSPEQDYTFLEELQPHDIQSLFLYDVDDSVLKHITHLTGLEELYLSNTHISDNGLLSLITLTGVVRLYIYHTQITDYGLMVLMKCFSNLKLLTCSGTAITEEGLQRFRTMMPACKVVSFKWRYDQ